VLKTSGKARRAELAKLAPPVRLQIDGVIYRVPPTMIVGQSFFLPVLDTQAAGRAVQRHYAPQDYKLIASERVEMGLLGIRVWRAA
jgi:hypothetical protein